MPKDRSSSSSRPAINAILIALRRGEHSHDPDVPALYILISRWQEQQQCIVLSKWEIISKRWCHPNPQSSSHKCWSYFHAQSFLQIRLRPKRAHEFMTLDGRSPFFKTTVHLYSCSSAITSPMRVYKHSSRFRIITSHDKQTHSLHISCKLLLASSTQYINSHFLEPKHPATWIWKISNISCAHLCFACHVRYLFFKKSATSKESSGRRP